MTKKKRAATYLRVSTTMQDVDMQRAACEKLIEGRGFHPVGEYVDVISGAKDTRPALSKMLAGAKRGEFDVLVVWKLDRLARSLSHLLKLLDELQSLGVEVVSHQEAIDTSSAMGRAMTQLIGVFAELEREMIRERVIAGLQRAKERGVKLGRPRNDVDEKRIIELHQEGKSYRDIAWELNLNGKYTVQRVLARHGLTKKGAAESR